MIQKVTLACVWIYRGKGVVGWSPRADAEVRVRQEVPM